MANNFQIRKKNMLDILRIVKFEEAYTKPDISKITGLTPATVNNLINDLLKKKIVIEVGEAKSTGGRKASIYKFNSNIFYAVGVDIRDAQILAGIFDFDLKLLNKKEVDCCLGDYSVEEGIAKIISVIQELIEDMKIDRERILGIGVSIKGPVDFYNGKIYQITRVPKWKNIPLASEISKKLNIETLVDKDNNNAMLYFKMHDREKSDKYISFLNTNTGIGTGFLMNGVVYRGKQCLAGELGHIRVESVGERCYCGKIGCIEPLASDYSIVKFSREKIEEGGKSLISKLCKEDLDSITLDMVVSAAQFGDELAYGILMKTAHYISILVGDIIKIYDPDEIIIECAWLRKMNDIFNYIMESVYEDNSFVNRERLKIYLSEEDNNTFYGAASLIFDHHLYSVENSKLIE